MKGKMKKKHREFLRNIAEGMTNAEAYVSSGHKAKNIESAAACASRLLRKLTENIPHRDLASILHTPLEIYSRIKELADSAQGQVAISALALETKCNGMQESPQDLSRGIPIIIVNQLPPASPGESLNPLDTIDVFPVIKPKQLTE